MTSKKEANNIIMDNKFLSVNLLNTRLSIDSGFGDSRRSSTCSSSSAETSPSSKSSPLSSKNSSRCSTRTTSENDDSPKEPTAHELEIFNQIEDSLTILVEEYKSTDNPFNKKKHIFKPITDDNKTITKTKSTDDSTKVINNEEISKKSFSDVHMSTVRKSLNKHLDEKTDFKKSEKTRKSSLSEVFPKRGEVSETVDKWLQEKMRFGFCRTVQSEYFTEISYEEEDFIDFEDGIRRIFDPYYCLEKDEISSVEGKVNSAGYPCSRALVTTTSGDELYGVWNNGLRNGMGTSSGENFTNHGVAQVQGTYIDGILHGYGSARLNQGAKIQAFFSNGFLEGPCVAVPEIDDSKRPNDLCNLDFKSFQIACYKKGIPTGYIWHSLEGGGWLHGKADERGKLTGDEIMFIYPDMHTCLCGKFQDGIMLSARLSHLESLTWDTHILVAIPSKQIFSNEVFCYSPSSTRGITVNTADPYESVRCVIMGSCIQGAGEGLFAKVDIAAGEVVSFYHGCYYPYGTRCDNADYDYQIFLDWKNAPKSDYLDVPPEYHSTENYNASLAHKANHSFSPNCEYIRFYHPRYCGQSLAIRTLRDILCGEEFTVNYKYDVNDAPDWFTQLCKQDDPTYFPVKNYHHEDKDYLV